MHVIWVDYGGFYLSTITCKQPVICLGAQVDVSKYNEIYGTLKLCFPVGRHVVACVHPSKPMCAGCAMKIRGLPHLNVSAHMLQGGLISLRLCWPSVHSFTERAESEMCT